MAKRKNAMKLGRRGFLKGAGVIGAAAVAPPVAKAVEPPKAVKPSVTPVQLAATEAAMPHEPQLTLGKGGGDFMVDVSSR